MSKWLWVAIGLVVVLIVIYRRGLARKKEQENLELQDVTGTGVRLSPGEILTTGGIVFQGAKKQATESIGNALTGNQPSNGSMRTALMGLAERKSTTITREEYEALPKAKIVDVATGEVVESQAGWGPSAPSRADSVLAQLSREEVAAMMPIVYSSPTAVRGNYRTAL
jgi:hypothetical protein